MPRVRFDVSAGGWQAVLRFSGRLAWVYSHYLYKSNRKSACWRRNRLPAGKRRLDRETIEFWWEYEDIYFHPSNQNFWICWLVTSGLLSHFSNHVSYIVSICQTHLNTFLFMHIQSPSSYN